VVADVQAGDVVTAQNVRSIRPASGLPPVDIDRVLGRAFTRNAVKGTPLSWDLI
jgi:N-acetylneuraminate synthase